MRNYDAILDLHPCLIGSISTIGGTAAGAPIDTLGFKDVFAILTAGACFGSGTGATVTLSVKMQESASLTGTGTAWADIANGQFSGTFAFSSLSFTGTDPAMQMGKKYERLQDGTRLRYIRALATLAGTVGLGPKFAVSFLLGRPNDTNYVANAVTQATGNGDFVKLY